jgi:hypothetical protein
MTSSRPSGSSLGALGIGELGTGGVGPSDGCVAGPAAIGGGVVGWVGPANGGIGCDGFETAGAMAGGEPAPRHPQLGSFGVHAICVLATAGGRFDAPLSKTHAHVP